MPGVGYPLSEPRQISRNQGPSYTQCRGTIGRTDGTAAAVPRSLCRGRTWLAEWDPADEAKQVADPSLLGPYVVPFTKSNSQSLRVWSRALYDVAARYENGSGSRSQH
jgi:hypothetical protein